MVINMPPSVFIFLKSLFQNVSCWVQLFMIREINKIFYFCNSGFFASLHATNQFFSRMASKIILIKPCLNVEWKWMATDWNLWTKLNVIFPSKMRFSKKRRCLLEKRLGLLWPKSWRSWEGIWRSGFYKNLLPPSCHYFLQLQIFT